MAEINIDATNTIVGRIGSFAAKQALLGNTVNVLNAELAVMTGRPELTISDLHYRIVYGKKVVQGPFISRMPDRFVRRTIRGMLPYKNSRGAAAYDRIMCYKGIPPAFKDKQLITLTKHTTKKLPTLKYMTVQQICRRLGGPRVDNP